jgi:SAM-dependent methyltransferase
MKALDGLLQRWREAKVRPWIADGARVLDIGCHQGEFLSRLPQIRDSVGLDPLAPPMVTRTFRLLARPFAAPLPFADGSFDVITMLATLEHIRDKQPLVGESVRLLPSGGRVVITVPSRAVDDIVHLLVRLRLADGMSLDEHHGFDPLTTPTIFQHPSLTLEQRERFQLGLNYLYVFRRA